ncbi:SRPBCC family protein [Flavilitoribacter nigricans]|nr:SRPBCC family protein [Flavilitoribacter nigricans]
MEAITKTLKLDISPETAFQKFVHDLNAWWPAEYTWSQESLERIYIDARKEGLCTEMGPHGFRCDWGRVKAIDPGKSIRFSWQISAKREPVPDPDKASEVQVVFAPTENGGTLLQFQHDGFEKHGPDGAQYRDMMDSEPGWTYILECFRSYCSS